MALLCLVLVAGCSSADDGDGEDAIDGDVARTEEPSPSPAKDAVVEEETATMASPVPESRKGREDTDQRFPSRGIRPAAARRALAAAVARMVEEPVTDFAMTLYVGPRPVTWIDGFHHRDGRWAASATLTAPDEESAGEDRQYMEVRSTDGKVWMQMRGWPPQSRGCWLVMPPLMVPLGFSALRPGEPLYVTALGSLHTSGFLDRRRDGFVGEIDLDMALSMYTTTVVDGLGIDDSQISAHRVPAWIGSDGERVTFIMFTGRSVLQTARAAGAKPVTGAARALRHVDVELEFPMPGDGNPDLQAPPRDLQITRADMAAGRGCS